MQFGNYNLPKVWRMVCAQCSKVYHSLTPDSLCCNAVCYAKYQQRDPKPDPSVKLIWSGELIE